MKQGKITIIDKREYGIKIVGGLCFYGQSVGGISLRQCLVGRMMVAYLICFRLRNEFHSVCFYCKKEERSVLALCAGDGFGRHRGVFLPSSGV